MTYHSIERKVEQAFKAYFGALAGFAVRTRFSGKTKALPSLGIVCDECEPAIRGESNEVLQWACSVKLSITTQYIKADEQEGADHDAKVGQIADRLADQSLLDGLSSNRQAGEGIKANLWKPWRRTNKVDGDEYVTELTGTLWARPY